MGWSCSTLRRPLPSVVSGMQQYKRLLETHGFDSYEYMGFQLPAQQRRSVDVADAAAALKAAKKNRKNG